MTYIKMGKIKAEILDVINTRDFVWQDVDTVKEVESYIDLEISEWVKTRSMNVGDDNFQDQV